MREPTRRVALAAGALAGTVGLSGSDHLEHWARPGLLGQTVALSAPGRRGIARSADDVLSGTRIAVAAAEGDRARLEAGEAEVREAAARSGAAAGLDAHATAQLTEAALDLHVLDAGLPAPIASWVRPWRLVWPRDAAHVAVAWTRLGLPDRAAVAVRTLAELAGRDGWFEARYVPGAARSPDARARQLDGTGWFLWALDVVARDVPRLLEENAVVRAARRCTDLLMGLTARTPHLPPPSPDYWEVSERRTSIATAALTAAGLERGSRILDDASAARRARAVRTAITAAYGPTGYSRYAGHRGADAGMVFLLPPYARDEDPGGQAAEVAAHLAHAEERMARPAGGLAPGELWRRDGVSWTPQTALSAQAWARLGETRRARERLAWLAAHRTAAGSLPEKVLADGTPASVAPLGWTAALVVSALL